MTVWVLDPEVHDLGEMGECYSLAWNDEGKSHISFPQGPFDEDEFWSRVQEGDKVYWVESIESDSIYPEYGRTYWESPELTSRLFTIVYSAVEMGDNDESAEG